MRLGRLFSDHYLREGIQKTEAYQRILADGASLAELRARLIDAFDRFPAATRPDEQQTEQDLIFRILEAIGWDRDRWLVQPRAARRGRADVPDMLLFADAEAKARANAEIDRDRRYRHGLAVVENKRWDRPFDRGIAAARRGDEEREVPSTQMLRYLSRAETLSNRKIQFGILTNGRAWRLYYQAARSRSEEFFELDLASLLTLATVPPDLLAMPPVEHDHWLRVFLLLFGRLSFAATDASGRTFHLLALDEGRLWEEKVAKDLSQLVFCDIFPRLIQALDAADPQRPLQRTPSYLRELKEGALTFLYRILFVLYAEDRGLLPVRDQRYRGYSMAVIRNDIAHRLDSGDTFSARAGLYHARLTALFHAIDRGDLTLGIPPYNGGLFAVATAPILERVGLSDAILAHFLDCLSRIKVEDRPRRINYSDLSVQQLGSIYERLLEHEVVEREGEIVIDRDDARRHGSGSYYTHEVLVQLILERTLGPLVKERVAAFKARATMLASDHRPGAERLAELAGLDPATRILELKLCDPAMGSGHFLVSAVDLLADRVLEAIAAAPRLVTFAPDDQPYELPLVARIAAIRTRILKNAASGAWKVDDDQLDDRRLVRRMILKRTIHGVDKNPMAVELAKVALWLHTFTVGAPLSFLDHHLRAGDSLLGLWIADAAKVMAERGGLLPGRHVVQAQLAAQPMAAIEEITDSDIADVEGSEAAYATVKEATEPLAAFLSLLQAERLMGVFDAAPRRRPSESRRSTSHEAELRAWNAAHALKQVLDGSLGDPISIDGGALRPTPQSPATVPTTPGSIPAIALWPRI